MKAREQPTARSLTDLLRLVLPILAAVISILIAHVLQSFDQHLANSLALKATANASDLWWLVPVAVATSFLSFEAALRIKSNYLAIVFLQVTALGLLLAWLCSQIVGSSSVLASLIASTIGFALGLMARAFKSAEAQQTSRYFELAIKNSELNETRLSLLKQDEADRRILASDLHDQVLNELKLIKSKVVALPDSEPPTKESISAIESSLDTAGKHIRDVMESLFPSVLENLGLCSALDQLTRDSCQKAHIQGRFIKSIEDRELETLTKTEELLLFRLTQEALNNVVKHAKAKTVRVTIAGQTTAGNSIEGQNNLITLSITDDGTGFAEKERGESRGLRYMRLRADLIGAKISWQANKGNNQDNSEKGTVVKIELVRNIG
ncbi:MAG: ATP-binding protein [Candidatus Obscuribacterales bacterium]|jgi:signal transduction histidine kinase